MEMTQEDFDERAKRVAAGDGTDEDLRLVKQYGQQGYTRSDVESGDRPSDGNSSETSSETQPRTGGTKTSESPSTAPTTAPHSKPEGTADRTARQTGGGRRNGPNS